MKLGVAMFFTDYSMTPQELGVAAEERGCDSVWSPEHSHIPLSRESAFPSGGDLPKKYYDAMDPFVALMAAAAVVASIDQLSNGRFLFGVGNGWNKDEMRNHGTAFETRHKLARERVEAMKAIWSKSKPEYHGEMVNFDPMMTWPKPVQKPHPPILVGGAFPYGARRAIRYGDGWMPHRARPQYPNVRDLLPEFRKLAAAANREVPVTIWGAKDEDMLKQDRDAGVVRVIISLESAKSGDILPELDRWSKLAEKVA
ncbi:MAG: LLM class flavin-dependent oxidoreductase [Alphaproteobacteria bacterium]|nr:MAG: LLM class flavin-dependent oxidoreductase [Alphaproteobacteria bacterium]